MKPRYHHGALREALIAAAAHLAADQGASAVTLREAARRAGVTQAAPYHYFRNKSELMSAVAEEGFRVLGEAQSGALARSGSEPLARLIALVGAYVRFALERPHFFNVMFRDARAPGPAATEVAARFHDTARAARLAAGHDDLDPTAMSTLVWAVPHGLAALYLDAPGVRHSVTPVLIEHLARAAIEPLVTLRDLDSGAEWAV